MLQNKRKISDKGLIIGGLIFMNAIILNAAITEDGTYYKVLFASVPLLVIMAWAYIVK